MISELSWRQIIARCAVHAQHLLGSRTKLISSDHLSSNPLAHTFRHDMDSCVMGLVHVLLHVVLLTLSFILHVCVSVWLACIFSVCRFFMKASGSCQSHRSLSSNSVMSSYIMIHDFYSSHKVSIYHTMTLLSRIHAYEDRILTRDVMFLFRRTLCTGGHIFSCVSM